MKEIRLKIPVKLEDLTERQLLFVSRLFLMQYSEAEFLVKALLYLAGMKLVKKDPAPDGARWYKVRGRRKPFLLTGDQLVVMAEKCRFLVNGGEVHPVKWIRKARARHYRLYNASFDEYLMAENYYFAFIETKKEEHLDNLISVLYRRPWQRWDSNRIRRRAKKFRDVDPAVKNAVFMWYICFRALVPKRCPNLFSGGKSKSEFSIRNYINGMVHSLNNGNITLTKQLLKQSCWAALDELEQRALQANELNQKK